ncbi:MAG: hypothetical protein ACT4OS_01745 [Acidimicrobiales bacterium]
MSRRPASPGQYRYDTVGTVVVGAGSTPLPAVTTLTVDPPEGNRQRSVRDLRDGSGNGSITETVLEYRPDGIYLVSVLATMALGGITDSRRLTAGQPLLFVPTQAVPGQVRRLELSTLNAAGSPVGTAVITTESEDRRVRVAVMLPPGDTTGTQELSVTLDPATGIYETEESRGDAVAAGGLIRIRTEYRATLAGRP